MNPKTAIVLALGILAILFAGVAILTNQPPTVVTIIIPSWLRAAGAVIGMGALALWLRRDLWLLIGPSFDVAADWLADDDSGVR